MTVVVKAAYGPAVSMHLRQVGVRDMVALSIDRDGSVLLCFELRNERAVMDALAAKGYTYLRRSYMGGAVAVYGREV